MPSYRGQFRAGSPAPRPAFRRVSTLLLAVVGIAVGLRVADAFSSPPANLMLDEDCDGLVSEPDAWLDCMVNDPEEVPEHELALPSLDELAPSPATGNRRLAEANPEPAPAAPVQRVAPSATGAIHVPLTKMLVSSMQRKVAETGAPRPRRLGDVGVVPLLNVWDAQYVGLVHLGRSRQPVPVIFDTGSSNMWVLGQQSPSELKQHRRYLYNNESSSTAAFNGTKLHIRYGSGRVEGPVVNDTVSFANLTISNQQFLQVLNGSLPQFSASGLIGLGFPALAVGGIYPPLQQLLAQRPDIRPVFSFSLSSVSGDFKSSLTIGAVNQSRVDGPFVPVPVLSATYWTIGLRQFGASLDSPNLCVARPCMAIVDSGTSLLGIPSRLFQSTMAVVTADHVCQPFGHSTAHAVRCQCPNGPEGFPTLRFSVYRSPMLTTMVELQPRDYIMVEHDDGAGAAAGAATGVGGFGRAPGGMHGTAAGRMTWCMPMLMPIDHTSLGADKVDVFVFGAVFLRTYMTEFDVERKRLRFARLRQLPGGDVLPLTRSTPSAFAVVSALFVLAMVIAVARYYYLRMLEKVDGYAPPPGGTIAPSLFGMNLWRRGAGPSNGNNNTGIYNDGVAAVVAANAAAGNLGVGTGGATSELPILMRGVNGGDARARRAGVDPTAAARQQTTRTLLNAEHRPAPAPELPAGSDHATDLSERVSLLTTPSAHKSKNGLRSFRIKSLPRPVGLARGGGMSSGASAAGSTSGSSSGRASASSTPVSSGASSGSRTPPSDGMP